MKKKIFMLLMAAFICTGCGKVASEEKVVDVAANTEVVVESTEADARMLGAAQEKKASDDVRWVAWNKAFTTDIYDALPYADLFCFIAETEGTANYRYYISEDHASSKISFTYQGVGVDAVAVRGKKEIGYPKAFTVTVANGAQFVNIDVYGDDHTAAYYNKKLGLTITVTFDGDADIQNLIVNSII